MLIIFFFLQGFFKFWECFSYKFYFQLLYIQMFLQFIEECFFGFVCYVVFEFFDFCVEKVYLEQEKFELIFLVELEELLGSEFIVFIIFFEEFVLLEGSEFIFQYCYDGFLELWVELFEFF